MTVFVVRLAGYSRASRAGSRFVSHGCLGSRRESGIDAKRLPGSECAESAGLCATRMVVPIRTWRALVCPAERSAGPVGATACEPFQPATAMLADRPDAARVFVVGTDGGHELAQQLDAGIVRRFPCTAGVGLIVFDTVAFGDPFVEPAEQAAEGGHRTTSKAGSSQLLE
ncbi:hypothetical protein F1D05_09615 [Kribbella qitaiheensis]|uniref:Uncharacterized protein n=1 Tax=Kribbella qitaiheensis TaxID=1544730 RepID=A0A7G6WVT2_9ACTN|nr:hypothetical protein [Kribbella qitaiheensis]QNE18097.1 hypothetical protein F1D05_09615 [Kribbella qitaiheensis]